MNNTIKKALTKTLLSSALLMFTTANQAQLFEAENFKRSFDLTVGNTGGFYKDGDVDIEACSDNGGGFNIGWIDTSEWLAYEGLNIPSAGRYKIKLRVSSPAGGQASIDLNSGELPLGNIDIPNTGGWQNWQTVEKTVDLSAGVFDLGVYAQTAGWNFNWIAVEALSEPPIGSKIKIEAEDYSHFNDTTPGNAGGAYRNDAVDIEATTDVNGGYNVGWWQSGEWLSYDDINITTAGNYQVKLRIASPNGASATVKLNSGTQTLGTLNIPATGDWQNWQTITLDTTLPVGMHSLGINAEASGWNLNWIEISPGGNGGDVGSGGRTLVWFDEFNNIDTSVWNHDEGGHGFGNNELQWYSNGSNVSIENDAQANSNVLVIEARQEQGGMCWFNENCGYTSGKLTTRHKKSFKYGRFEARMKLPRMQGIWPAFWMLGDNFNTQGWPQGGEIDIMEHVNTNNITSGALHGPGYSGNTPITGHLTHVHSIDADYHIYAVEWDENGIDWFVDNIKFYSVTKAEVSQHGEYVYDAPFWFLLNLAVGGNWPGDPDHANFTTSRMYVDYIRVYQ